MTNSMKNKNSPKLRRMLREQTYIHTTKEGRYLLTPVLPMAAGPNGSLVAQRDQESVYSMDSKICSGSMVQKE